MYEQSSEFLMLKEASEQYAAGDPIMSDAEYDALQREYESEGGEFPVGASPVDSMPKVAHLVPMKSLKNARSEDEIRKFEKSVLDKLSASKDYSTLDVEFVGEIKYDGVSVSLVYEKGYFTRAVTRGDGTEGNDVTHLVRHLDIPRTPEELDSGTSALPQLMEVRGELMLHHAAFEALNARMKEEGKRLFSNPRNAAAGSLMMKGEEGEEEFKKRGLTFHVYSLQYDGMPATTQRAAIRIAHMMGFPVTSLPVEAGKTRAIVQGSIRDMIAHFKKLEEVREYLGFDIDGFVVKVNYLEYHKHLAGTDKYPDYAIAWKFGEKAQSTTLKDVVWQVGRTGKVTPVAVMAPVELGGVTVTNATLCNQDEINRLGLHYGDVISVCRGGDVIPKVLSAKAPPDTVRGAPVAIPNVCPVCGGKLEKAEGIVDSYCTAGYKCGAQLQASIEHFVSRDALNIEGVGGKLIAKLLEAGKIKHAFDLFNITYDDVTGIEGYKDTSASKVIAAINAAKVATLPRFIISLGIREVGAVTAEKLAEHFKEIGYLAMAKEADFLKVEGVGITAAKNLEAFFWGEEFIRVILPAVRRAGFKVRKHAAPVPTGNLPLEGMTFTVTGKIQTLSRALVESKLKKAGAKISKTITKQTTHLLYGSNPGGKLDEAKNKGATLVSVTETWIQPYVR